MQGPHVGNPNYSVEVRAYPNSVLKTMAIIARDEGLLSLYKGATISVAKSSLCAASTFWCAETIYAAATAALSRGSTRWIIFYFTVPLIYFTDLKIVMMYSAGVKPFSKLRKLDACDLQKQNYPTLVYILAIPLKGHLHTIYYTLCDKLVRTFL